MNNQQQPYQPPMMPQPPVNNGGGNRNNNTLLIVLLVVLGIIVGLLVALLIKPGGGDSDKQEPEPQPKEKAETVIVRETTNVVVKNESAASTGSTSSAVLNAYRNVLNRNKGGKYFLVTAPGCKYPTIWATTERVHINDKWNYSDEPQIVVSGYKVTSGGYSLIGHINVPTWADVMCANGKVGYWGGSSGSSMAWNISSGGMGYGTTSGFLGSPNWHRVSDQSAVRAVVGQ